jgi:hypothetical protein
MPSQDNITAALYATVLADTGQPGGGALGQSYYCLEQPGFSLARAQYANALSAENPAGSAEAFEAFSMLVDEVPALSPLYVGTDISFASIYGLLLQATVAGGGVVARAFAAAQEKFQSSRRGSINTPTLEYHGAYAQPSNWAANDSGSPWQTLKIGGGVPVPAPPAILRPALGGALGKVAWRFAGETPPIIARPRPPLVSAAAQPPQLARPMATSVTLNPGLTKANASVIASRQSALALRSGGLNDARPGVAHLNSALAAKLRLNTPAVPARPTVPAEEHPSNASDIEANLEMLRVDIQRDWFDPTILQLPGWSLEGIARGFFSNPADDANAGLCALVPTAFIAVRNVRIRAKWSPSDIDGAQRSVSKEAGQAAFGPFSLRGEGQPLSAFDGTELFVPGPQIVAWVCRRLPVLPP